MAMVVEKPKRGIDAYTVDDYRPNCCCPFDNPEAVGYVMVSSMVTGIVVMASVFLSAAILELATRSAGCGYLYESDEDAEELPKCNGRVYGMRPATIYYLTYTVAAVTTALCNPLIGAVVDHTRFRKGVAAGALALLVLLVGAQMCVGRGTWAFVCLLEIGVIFCLMLHSAASAAYLPELSQSQFELTRISAHTTGFLFVTEVSFVVVVAGLGVVLFGVDGTVPTARLGQGVACVLLLYVGLHGYARLLRGRPRPVVPLRTALKRGLTSLAATWSEISAHHPDLRTYLIGVAFVDAAVNAYAVGAAGFVVGELGGSGSTLAAVILCLLVVAAACSPLVNYCTAFCASRWGDEHSGVVPLKCAMAYLVATTAVAPLAFQGDNALAFVFVFAALWGVGFSFYYALLRPVCFFMVPTKDANKFTGVYSLAQMVLSWAPPLSLSLIYNSTGSLRLGFLVLAVFIVIGLACILQVDVKRGRAAVVAAAEAGEGLDDIAVVATAAVVVEGKM